MKYTYFDYHIKGQYDENPEGISNMNLRGEIHK